MKKKIIWIIIIITLSVAFIIIPFPASDLIIRIYFDDITGSSCALYYATDDQNFLSDERCIVSAVDYEKKRVEFRLDGSLEGHITGLRLDWPAEEQLICVKNITVSSGGVVKKEYNPCVFFAEENISFSNETSATLVHPRGRVYLSIGANDPNQMLSESLVDQIQSYYSHQRFSRLFVCLFIACSFLFAKKKIFQ